MGRRYLVVLLLVAAVATLASAAAEAKFKVSLTAAPSRPLTGKPVRLTMRTAITLPAREGVTLIAVGPWRDDLGQAVHYVRLVRTGPRVFRTTLRLQYAGRWSLQAVMDSGAILIGRQLSVRATPQ
jgi:hypothetical protein